MNATKANKTSNLQIRCTDAQKQVIDNMAWEAHLSTSAFILSLLRKEYETRVSVTHSANPANDYTYTKHFPD